MNKKQGSIFNLNKKTRPNQTQNQNFFFDQRLGSLTIKELQRKLQRVEKKLSRYSKETESRRLTEAEKAGLAWFFENIHYIEEARLFIEEALDVKSAAHFPLVDTDNSQLRILRILSAFMVEKKRFTASTLAAYLNHYQKNHNLTLSELWFIPTGLQFLAIIKLEKCLSQIFNNNSQKKIAKIDQEIQYLVLIIINSGKINWKNFVEKTSTVEKILAKDPAKIYRQMDFKTRDAYRHVVEEISRRTGWSEPEVAKLAYKMAKEGKEEKRHIGYFLAGPAKKELEVAVNYQPHFKERAKRIITKTEGRYLVLFLILASSLVTFLISSAINQPLISVIALPLFITSLVALETLFNRLLIKIFSPQPLFKLDCQTNLSVKQKTLVAIPTLLTENPKDPEILLENLELNYLTNKDPFILFALVLSFRETKEREDQPTESELENLNRLITGLDVLNKKYSQAEDIFMIIFRKRSWNECQEVCVEWERKRGKIIELTRLLRGGGQSGFHLVTVDSKTLETIKYVITLDQGELLTKGAAKKLIGAISHPLNRPVVDPKTRTVRSGYGIIQPTMVGFRDHEGSLLVRLFGGQGWDSYSGLTSNVYQDIFSEGAFFGKGIFDVDTFQEVIDGRFLENTILSHDLIEGFYCRTGYASDIQVFEEEPHSYISFAQRKERWIRGDWQNLFWLFGRITQEKNKTRELNPLLLYHKWRVLGNILRSLIFPLTAFLLVYGWLFLDKNSAIFFTVILLLTLNSESIAALFSILPSKKAIIAWRFYLKKSSYAIMILFVNIIFKTVFALHLGILSFGAIVRALYRVFISRRKTLEWQAFHLTKGSNNFIFLPIMNFMFGSQVVAFLVFFFYLFKGSQPFPLVIIISWLFAPFLAFIFSIEWPKKKVTVTEKDEKRLRLIALKTWRFFEELVTEKSNHLPPDNYLDLGKGKASPMTSITNIGVYLLSAKAATDLGYLSTIDFLERLDSTLKTVEKLSRVRGHFYNWYEVKTNKSLPPHYVSTVDSGNFATSLLALRSAAEETLSESIFNSSIKEALDDYIIMMLRAHDDVSLGSRDEKELKSELELFKEFNLKLSYNLPVGSISALTQLHEQINKITDKYQKYNRSHNKENFDYWLNKSEELVNQRMDLLSHLYPWTRDESLQDDLKHWFDVLNFETELEGLKDHIELKKSSLESEKFTIKQRLQIEALLQESLGAIKAIEALVNTSIQVIDKIIAEMDFKFLYDEERELLRIGYNDNRKRYDKNFYDLLASESQLASYFAIAHNNLPLDHWSKLGRPLAHYHGSLVLLSWGGSIFEYFFSRMFLPVRKGSLLNIAHSTALRMQIDYGHRNDIPWGISESSYVQNSQAREYLYKMHGVPALGMRRVSKKDRVVAPYATLLALEESPQEALENIKRLQKIGVENKYGFYESIDFTRKANGEIAKVYMAHHQGAIIISIVNFLKDRPFEKRFMKNKEAKAVSYLLDEETVIRGKIKNVYDLRDKSKIRFQIEPKEEPRKDAYYGVPLVHLLSNGRFRSFISNRGSGSLEYENIELIPSKSDPTFDNSGTHIYLKDNRRGVIWSATYQPTLIEPEEYDFKVTDNYFQIKRHNFGITSNLEIFLHPKLNAEIRILTLTNKSQQRRSLAISSYGEVSFFGRDEYRSHPNFQKLKVYLAKKDPDALIFRKNTSKGEHSPLFVHAVIRADRNSNLDFLTERSSFIGYGSLALPAAILSDRTPKPSAGLDKIFATKQTITLLPFEKKTIIYINLYIGKEERLEGALDELRKKEELIKIRDLLKIKKKTQSSILTLMQLTSILLYNNNHHQPNPMTQEVKNRFPVDWSLPSVVLEVKESFSKIFVESALRHLSVLARKGLRFNLLVITHEKDEYSKQASSFIERTTTLIEGKNLSTKNALSDKMTLINNAVFEKRAREELISMATLYLDASKRSLDNLIESSYRKM